MFWVQFCTRKGKDAAVSDHDVPAHQAQPYLAPSNSAPPNPTRSQPSLHHGRHHSMQAVEALERVPLPPQEVAGERRVECRVHLAELQEVLVLGLQHVVRSRDEHQRERHDDKPSDEQPEPRVRLQNVNVRDCGVERDDVGLLLQSVGVVDEEARHQHEEEDRL